MQPALNAVIRPSVCPLDCPDTCSLSVEVANEKIVAVRGSDANPYVAMAMTLACGYLGIKNKIQPKPEMKGDAYLSPYALPRSLGEALDWLRRESDLHEVLGKEFITVYSEIKELEFEEFMKVISPWEREHLLLHV